MTKERGNTTILVFLLYLHFKAVFHINSQPVGTQFYSSTRNLCGSMAPLLSPKQVSNHQWNMKLLGISKNSRQHYTAVIGAECWSLGLLATKHWKVFTSYSRTADKHNHSSENRQFKNNSKTVLLHQTTTTTTTVVRPLYRSTCVSRHLQLRTGAFCCCTVLLPACPC